ncbi:MAG: hypothetical protein HOV73_23845 [Streptomyces sp.]|uniref:hypothetical protein n=1 Tax=Streptomyces sp. NBC_00663 TaxID=2975801 RepID=UPI0018270069|nr:hypothetical protein [Streptomyces sp. NBC_00663]NUR43120.1 hypothetical protein [Streptomyces sp.]NUS26355.1 hypothetical protein [Streptomyces sp.]NUS80820.1 hypothetical protein [Streptomyces sp.]
MLSKDKKKVQTTRAWTGLLVVVVGDIGVALAAILVALHLKDGPQSVAILTSAFTAITAISTAYFGIRAAANAAQSAVDAAGGGEDKTEHTGGDGQKKVAG